MSDPLSPPNRKSRASVPVPVPVPGKPRRPATSSWFAKVQLFTGVIVVIAASVLVAWGLRRYLHKSPRFAVASIPVQGNRRLGPQAVVKQAGLATGDNVFDIDEDRCRGALQLNPWIESAKVQKELPDTVRITIVEREARLTASIDGKMLLADARGVLFKESEVGDPTDLPIVTGIKPADIARDREGVTLRLRRVLDLLADLEAEQIPERLPIQEVHIDGDGDLTVFAGTDGIALTFGQPPYRLKVEKGKRILAELRARRVKPDALFLDNRAHPERVVVRMRSDEREDRK
jgi:cell division protein FtsQ